MRKKSLCILFTLLGTFSFNAYAYADNDPVICQIEINYDGKNYTGNDDGMNETEAVLEAKSEACDSACRLRGDACEVDCMAQATVSKQNCYDNPKAVSGNSDSYFCRALVKYDGQQIEGDDSSNNLEKAGRKAFDEACNELCDNRSNEKQCEQDCRIQATVIGLECTDRNNKVVERHGEIPSRAMNNEASKKLENQPNVVHPLDKLKANSTNN